MSLLAGILLVLTVLMLAAVVALVWMMRAVISEAHAIDEDTELSDSRRKSFFDWLNPFSWWRKDDTIRLFYQRDAKGRFRKVRRH
ncbi:hypothetical protein [Altererythrobacter sp. MF3-039]|uniref:hypothetical protein n=1 Tax=Altererythrobacter sp. MF3-039 TaxID=3252901 RepID=UPI00390C985A